MTVTAETVREVAEELRANDLGGLADSLDIYAKKLLPAPDPDIELGMTLRDAYYDDGEDRLWAPNLDWLRVAASARKALNANKYRKFTYGDPEPDDITYVYDGDGDLFKKCGRDCWALKILATGGFGSKVWNWNDITVRGATEVFGDFE